MPVNNACRIIANRNSGIATSQNEPTLQALQLCELAAECAKRIVCVVHLMVCEWKEDQASLPIRIKHKLLPVTASHNISKAEVIHMDARCPDPAGKQGLAIQYSSSHKQSNY